MRSLQFVVRQAVQKALLPEIRACLTLAVPLAGAQLAQSMTGFTDTVMMGWLGSQALAAGGLAAVVFMELQLVATGVLSAVSPLVAEAYGSGHVKQAGRITQQGLWIALLISLPGSVFVWHGGILLRLLGQNEQIVTLSESYLQAIAWGVFPALGFVVLRNFISAISRPRIILWVMLLGAGFNVAANYVLMFGHLGFPALGLAGVGWASTCTYWVVFGAIAAYVLTQSDLKAYQLLRRLHQFDFDRLRALLQLGWPIGVLFAVETGLFAITTFLAGLIGTNTLAAHHIALQTASMTFMVPLGISYATTIRVGQRLGQGDRAGARGSGYVGMGIGVVFMGLMALILWLMPERVVSIYLNLGDRENQAVIQIAIQLLSVAALFQVFDGLQVIAAGALRGLKDTRIPMMLGTMAYWGLGFTSSYWLAFRVGLGGVGLWWGLALGLAIAALLLSWRFRRLTVSVAVS